MNERPAYIDVFILILVADGWLPPAAWDDLAALLAPPKADPAPGQEFAPAEVSEAVVEGIIRPGIARLAAQFQQRVAREKANPTRPSEHEERIRRTRAELAKFLERLPGLGIQIVGEVEPLDEP